MEDYVVKHVDLQKQPHLRHQLSDLQEMYTATKGSQHLIRSETGPTVRIKYTVILSPYGDRLGNGYLSMRIRSTTQLQAAIRCILLALQDLHAANFAHTDIRWPNVIKCSDDVFCLIALEAAVRLGCQWDVSKDGPHRVSWTRNTLANNRYTAESDLALVGQLLTHPELPALGKSGSQFAKELIDKSSSVQQALHHAWLRS